MSEPNGVPPIKTGLAASFNGGDFSLNEAIGGLRGIVESLLPGLVFVVAYVVSGQLWWTVGLSAGVSILFVVVRLLQRTPMTQALAGLLGVAIGIVWAISSGKAENYYAWGLLTNLVYGSALLLSVLIGQPLAAWAVRFLWGLPPGWAKQAAFRTLYRRSMIVTWVWVAVFALRLAIQAPLYFASAVAPLGVAKLVLGLPLFAVAAWLTWVLLRGQQPKASTAGDAPTQESDSAGTSA